ncbi:MAG: class I SAM-dependent methyltransferase [Deltaproteobacteria bacterium]|nr:class I SAM-dependent methyltransferase [Deltaproteobacteria bacterium]
MKLNWAERWVVNNPIRVLEQRLQMSWFKARAPLDRGGIILEIGAGRGAGASLILREFHPSVLHASDLDYDMIRRAKDYLSPGERARISLITADATHLPYRDQALDAVFGFGFLHHVPEWRAALDEVARILKGGGIYFMEELYPSLYQNCITRHLLVHPTEDRFRSADLRIALKERGFRMEAAAETRHVGILAILRKD